MKRSIGLLMAAALLLAGCGDGASGDTTAAEPTVTTMEAAETTTTSASATTTTEAPTTTEQTSQPTVGGSVDDFDALMARVDAAGEPTSARIEGRMELIGVAGPDGPIGDVTVPFSAAYDSATGDSSFSMDLAAMVAAFPGDDIDMGGLEDTFDSIEVRDIGDTSYIKFGFFTSMMGADTEWVSMPREDGDGFSEDMTQGVETNPNDLLDAYREADASVEEVGRETVNGTETTHYSVIVDTEALLADMSEEERAQLEADGPVPSGTFPLDLWISDEGYIVRAVIDIDGSLIEEQDPTETFERMVYTFDVFDIGASIAIEPPPPSAVTPVDELAGMFGTG